MPRDATGRAGSRGQRHRGGREIPLPLLWRSPRSGHRIRAGPAGSVGGRAAPDDLRDVGNGRWTTCATGRGQPRWNTCWDPSRRPGGKARLVVVPVGDLSLVPWHAARRPVVGGDFRYACQDAAISYAASARQFTEACRNRHRPWRSAAAMVRVPGSRLFFASREAQEIHRRHYANGTLLGRRWPVASSLRSQCP